MRRSLLLLLLVLALGATLLVLFEDQGPRPGPEQVGTAAAAPDRPTAAGAPSAADPTPDPAAALPPPEVGRTEIRREPALAELDRSVMLRARLVDELGRPIEGGTLLSITLGPEEVEDLDAIRGFLLALSGGETEGQPIWTATADASGLIEMKVPEPKEQWSVFAQADGRRMSVVMVDPEPGQAEYQLGDIKLAPGATVVAAVVDGAGRPLEGVPVMVSIVSFEDMAENDFPFRIAKTLADGTCRLDHLAPGSLSLSAKPAGRPTLSLGPFEVGAGETSHQRLVLHHAGEIQVQVLEAGGEAAAGVEVRASAEDSEQSIFGGFLEEIWDDGLVTDQAGRVTLTGIDPALQHSVSAWRNEDISVEQDRVSAGDRITLTLPASCGVRGRILTAAGLPAEDALVLFPESEATWADLSDLTTLGPDGRFGAELPAGSYGVAARHESGEAVFEQPGPIEGPVELADLALPAGGELVVRVVSSAGGAAVDGFDLEEIDPQPDGEEGHPLDQKLSELEDLGYGNGDGEPDPVERARLLLSRLRPAADPAGPGRQRWSGLRAGPFRFAVDAAGFVRAEHQLTILPGGTHEVRVELRPAAELEVLVRMADGALAEGWTLCLAAEGEEVAEMWPWSEGSHFDQSDGAGKVLFTALEPGTYLLFDTDDYRASDLLGRYRLPAGRTETEVVLPPLYELTVAVLGREGPVAGAEVTLTEDREVDPDRFWFGGEDHQNTREDGQAVFEKLRRGSYDVLASREGGLPFHARAEVPGTGTLTLELRGVAVAGRVVGGTGERRVTLERTAPPESLSPPSADEVDHGWIRRRGMAYGAEASVLAAADGSFRFEEVPAGHYEILVSVGDGYQPEVPEIEVGGLDLDGIVVVCEAAGRIVLRVLSYPEDGEAYFLAMLAKEDDSPRSTQFIEGGGDYEFDQLSPGSYRLEILAGGQEEPLATWTLPVNLGPPTVIEWVPPDS